MAASKSTAVAKKGEAPVPAGWEDYAGGQTGFEDVDRSELAIPFINLLQSNSEMVEDGNAKQGQFYNNVMETVMDDFLIVPACRQRVFVEWIPVDDGGGLVGVHEPDSMFVQDAIRANDNSSIKLTVKGEDGKTHDLVETIYLYVLILDGDGGYERAVIGFSSMKLKKYRQFITKATSQMMAINGRKFKLPLWSHRWKVTSTQEVAKSNGKKFQNISIAFDGETAKQCRLTPADELFQEAENFHDMVMGGLAKADVSGADQADSGNGGGQRDGSADSASEEEIPF